MTGQIAKVEVNPNHYLFQFSPWTAHAVGDTIAGAVATPATFGGGAYTQLYSFTGNNTPATLALVTGALVVLAMVARRRRRSVRGGGAAISATAVPGRLAGRGLTGVKQPACSPAPAGSPTGGR